MCKKILNADNSIRFAGVINYNGRLVTGAVKTISNFMLMKGIDVCYSWRLHYAQKCYTNLTHLLVL